MFLFTHKMMTQIKGFFFPNSEYLKDQILSLLGLKFPLFSCFLRITMPIHFINDICANKT